jgi:hypothetical protein
MARAISTGPNSRPLDDTIAETGPGIPDDPVGPGELRPGDLGVNADAQVEALRAKGWTGERSEDEAEAHPS